MLARSANIEILGENPAVHFVRTHLRVPVNSSVLVGLNAATESGILLRAGGAAQVESG
jgi:hypothetical protein